MWTGRKAAVVLLAIVALWAAMPAFACLPTAAPCACCCAMMHNCDLSASMSGNECCALHSHPDAIPPDVASGPDHLPDTAVAPAALYLAPSLALETPVFSAAEDSPPRNPSSRSSILRI